MLPGGMYQWRKGNDTLTRERYGLEHHFLLDSPVADRIQWSLNYQLAKTDQATRELLPDHPQGPAHPRHYLQGTPVGLRQPVGQELRHRRDRAPAELRDQSQAPEGHRHAQRHTGTNLDTGADSPRDALERSSDFPDPTVKTYALFAQDSISWNDWTFTPGLRYDYTRMEPHITDEFLRTMKQSQNTAVDESDKKWHRVSPKFGVTYDFAQHYTWYGQYAQGFRTPTAKALYGRFENLQAGYHIEPNPNLKPEKSQSFETGLRGKFDEGSFGVAVFYNKYRDFIDEDALNTDSTGGNGQTFQSNNIERAVIKGVELKGRLELGAFGAPQALHPGQRGLRLRSQQGQRRADQQRQPTHRSVRPGLRRSRRQLRRAAQLDPGQTQGSRRRQHLPHPGWHRQPVQDRASASSTSAPTTG